MNDAEFQSEIVDNVDGWLQRAASLRTMGILAYQERSEIDGPILEIGVYKGKYLSVLARSAQRTGDRVLGVDTFQFVDPQEVLDCLSRTPETADARVELWKCFSHECTAQATISKLGARPRFISIDGSHEKEDVFLDLVLAEQIVSSKGIVAVDDFINPVAFGVNEAVHMFFSIPRKLVPVAYIDNKLFLSHRAHAGYYRYSIEQDILQDQTDVASVAFRERAAMHRSLVEQKLWGEPLLTCPLPNPEVKN